MARGQRPIQRTARNYRAYDQSQRSSRVTADVVYRLGHVPKPVDIKTTIGTMPRRQRGRGRRSQYGGAYELDDIQSNDLIKIAKAQGVTGGNKLERVWALKEAGVTFDQAREILQRFKRKKNYTRSGVGAAELPRRR